MIFRNRLETIFGSGSKAWRLVQAPLESKIARQAGWVVGANISSQFLRLLTNVILTRLLAPQLFGIMVIVNSLRTGIELVSDVGIGQNIVRSPSGDSPEFLSTAWTLQVFRGILLTLVGLAVAYPLAAVYEQPILGAVFAAASATFFISGLISPGRFLLQKRQQVRQLAFFEIGVGLINLVVHVVIAYFVPTIWGLIAALLVSTCLATLLSGLLLSWRKLKFMIVREHLRDILSFGKWLLISSLIFFGAMNFDRLYLGSVLPLAVLGIYGVARSLSDAFAVLANRACSLLVFPKVAEASHANRPLRKVIAPARIRALLLVALALAFAISISDQLVLLVYDPRYSAAAFILPILLAGVWFTILATVGEAVLMGISKPASTAFGNGAKFVWICTGVPLAMAYGSFTIALIVISLSDIVRYVVLSVSQIRSNLSFFRQDAFLTFVLIGFCCVFRWFFLEINVVPDMDIWWTYGATLP